MTESDPLPLQLELRRELGHLLNAGVDKIRHCLAQLTADQIWWRPSPELNSVGNLVLHIAGNLRQWIVVGLGNELDRRDRDAEFATTGGFENGELLDVLDKVVREVRSRLASMTEAELIAERTIQGFSVTGIGAVLHSIPHAVGHVHQIVLLTRLQLGDDYEFHWKPGGDTGGVPV